MKEASLFPVAYMDFKDEAVILRDGLFAVQIFWKSVFHNMGNVPLDQRLRVSQEIIADIGTVFVIHSAGTFFLDCKIRLTSLRTG